MQFNTIGGVAKPGETLLEITPSEGPLAVEARVRPDDRIMVANWVKLTNQLT
jgi:hypothetical protein